ncbi:hypothetical protein, partial [Salinicola sp.]|uniref:hypothetical protein n=1 Tax=Salinicola sp. TaxID=1978524 RepID=UPI0025E8FC23
MSIDFDLWIDPDDNRRMANANDGGGNVWVATGIQFFDLVGEVLQTPVLHSPMNGHLIAAETHY